MKLQNMTVIFVIIILPIILLTTYYISLQIDTLNMQASYNEKLLEAVRESIEAFEINTVEWNEAYSETADSKRRDIMASVNTFITSFANGMGIGGINKEYIFPYIPALAYTLYDGYYIYSPTETKETVKNNNGVTVFITQELVRDGIIKGSGKYDYKNNRDYDGKILYQYDTSKGGSADGTYNGISFTLDPNYAKTTYSHILKPFSSYSARYKKSNTDITVNYTLDSYITIYGNVKGTYVTRSGYFIDISNIAEIRVNDWQGLTLKNNIKIDKEVLSERIAWKKETSDENYTIEMYNYVYATDNTKVYFDKAGTPFQVNSNGIRIDLKDLPNAKYKKLVVLVDKENGICREFYQALNTKNGIEQGKWYSEMNNQNSSVAGINGIGLQEDVSAIDYYVEAYSFTTWVKNNLSNITVDDMLGEKSEINVDGKIFDVKNPEDEESIFFRHKREVIKQTVISSLNQAITSYSRNSEGDYILPVLDETDWDQILRNISIVAFVQNIPIGLKTYNNYAVATSTSNKEYVDPNEIYLTEVGDIYYHLPYCDKIGEGELVGYRSIDYIAKSYEINEESQYYYSHSSTDTSYQPDYYCLVQHSLYSEDKTANKVKAYETALARERYVAREFN